MLPVTPFVYPLPGVDPELDFGGVNCLFHVKSFLTLLFAIGNIADWGPWRPAPCIPLPSTLLLDVPRGLHNSKFEHYMDH